MDLLTWKTTSFNQAAPEEKFNIVTEIMQEFPDRRVVNNVFTSAISAGCVELVEKFLTVINHIRDPRLTVFGGVTQHTLAHVSLDPHIELYDFEESDVPLENRLAIIRLLGKKGAYVDYNPEPGQILPLSHAVATFQSVQPTRKKARIAKMIVCALLYGANPDILNGIDILKKTAIFYSAYKQHKELIQTQNIDGVNIDAMRESFDRFETAKNLLRRATVLFLNSLNGEAYGG